MKKIIFFIFFFFPYHFPKPDMAKKTWVGWNFEHLTWDLIFFFFFVLIYKLNRRLLIMLLKNSGKGATLCIKGKMAHLFKIKSAQMMEVDLSYHFKL